ncbi:uncharacterized protein B0H18DRAFT_633261 [Fomitopsis serialis]|uniref:uncharacterized protein n=1 Tax=Fomitopsis serialis TaxID=139415 RepID=UPI0020077872|nr:uncharacterized protein B0H18DRAFT_633261 [Neoantrodia serialis]KAH9919546.1 hypothetical protein B0H18DRAFT_633261 [Neoantrodia serialis]
MVPEPSSIVPVYCRYVHTDRWLLTHLDASWTISQVKQHLLTKFLPTSAPSLRKPARARRDRPLSPITFSSHGHSDNEGDSDYQSAEENGSVLDAQDGFVDDGEFYRYKYAPASRPIGTSSITLVVPPEASLPSPANFTAIAFSTGQLLEDPFQLSWYALQPYELLEFYPRGEAFITLPRHNLEAYVRPYFEARVWALRFVGDNLSAEHHAELERPKSKGKGKGKERDRRTGSGSGPTAGDGGEETWGGDADETKRRLERKHRKKMEWRERWVVMHQGMFKLCRNRSPCEAVNTCIPARPRPCRMRTTHLYHHRRPQRLCHHRAPRSLTSSLYLTR